MHVITAIQAKAELAGMSEGVLLRLAREVAHNAALPSIEFLTEAQRAELDTEVSLILGKMLVSV